MTNESLISPLRCWYTASIETFLQSKDETVLGQLTTNCDFTLLPTQRDAWLSQIDLLRRELINCTGSIFFEFKIPRVGRRIDVVLIIGPVVFPIEFKIGEKVFDRSGIDQAWDYALDLKNFHEASHNVSIVPIVVATEAANMPAVSLHADADRVFRPLLTNGEGLREVLDSTVNIMNEGLVDGLDWAKAPYHPTPTIIEAARALYSQHSVEAIARFDAGAQNLHTTSRRIEHLMNETQANGRKAICFVTGVPGAGKTLVGLNLATHERRADKPTHAVFLSGNGPLVAVLREALTRDEVVRRRQQSEKVRKGKIAESVKAFIQNVHHFRDDALVDSRPPIEHVVIFDEAQRAWNARQTASFMLRKKKHPGFAHSEPEFLISCMDRHKDWAFIVCLVGGGQEINTGEAGIEAWLEAANTKFAGWHMHISSRLTDSEYTAGKALTALSSRPNTHFENGLHLAVSMRSFRAENVSTFVKALLDCEESAARAAFAQLADKYPIAVTRDLQVAKDWIRSRARGTERYGLVASSKALRLKPHAIDIRVAIDPVHYFLNDKDDVRSSYYLEDAATEFQVQGLELDWACLTWDGDLRFTGNGWSYHDFRGARWCNIGNEDNKNYLRNAYRVLLTRARQGMVVFVPPGDSSDPTRSPGFYDLTFGYLKRLGIPEIA